jgi:hypothetical protein
MLLVPDAGEAATAQELGAGKLHVLQEPAVGKHPGCKAWLLEKLFTILGALQESTLDLEGNLPPVSLLCPPLIG